MLKQFFTYLTIKILSAHPFRGIFVIAHRTEIKQYYRHDFCEKRIAFTAREALCRYYYCADNRFYHDIVIIEMWTLDNAKILACNLYTPHYISLYVPSKNTVPVATHQKGWQLFC